MGYPWDVPLENPGMPRESLVERGFDPPGTPVSPVYPPTALRARPLRGVRYGRGTGHGVTRSGSKWGAVEVGRGCGESGDIPVASRETPGDTGGTTVVRQGGAGVHNLANGVGGITKEATWQRKRKRIWNRARIPR